MHVVILTTNRGVVDVKDNRAVGISDAVLPFTASEAEMIVALTNFLLEGDESWRIEVRNPFHTCTSVEATTVEINSPDRLDTPEVDEIELEEECEALKTAKQDLAHNEVVELRSQETTRSKDPRATRVS